MMGVVSSPRSSCSRLLTLLLLLASELAPLLSHAEAVTTTGGLATTIYTFKGTVALNQTVRSPTADGLLL